VAGPASRCEDLLAGLAGKVSHLLQRVFQAAAVGDPLLIERGVLGREELGDGLAALLPGELPAGAVAVLGIEGYRETGRGKLGRSEVVHFAKSPPA
jgi:hypothetical protein